MEPTFAARLYRRLVLLALVLTFVVIVLGAWVRLTDAGLGCPDWPGCYGTLGIPDSPAELERARDVFPGRPVETGKAWREMIHRYFASTLGLIVLVTAAAAIANRRDPDQPLAAPLLLVALVVVQGLLGMLTVTWLLKPLIVMSHLLGGMATLALLGWLTLGIVRRRVRRVNRSNFLPRLAAIGLAAVVIQIALGGWTSANYAALACPDFPTCQAEWWPRVDLGEGFVLWRGLGTDYEGGVLDNPARTAIHMVHRSGALIVTLLLGFLVYRCLASAVGPARKSAAILLAMVLAAQLAIGITIVVQSLPLWLASAHNGVAALLLLAVINLNHVLRYAAPKDVGAVAPQPSRSQTNA